jgi:hypothetical protein
VFNNYKQAATDCSPHRRSFRSWGSSVTTLSDYRLDYRGSVPGRGKEFFLTPLCPDRLWSPPACCTMGTGGAFPGSKARPGRDSDHSPHVVPRSRMSKSYALSPCRLHDGSGTALLYLLACLNAHHGFRTPNSFCSLSLMKPTDDHSAQHLFSIESCRLRGTPAVGRVSIRYLLCSNNSNTSDYV